MAPQEEFIADLVHQFLLPEVGKQVIRKRINERQKQNLKQVHESLYSQMDNLPKWSQTTLETIISGEQNIVNIFQEDDIEYFYRNQDAAEDMISVTMPSDYLQLEGSISSASIISNISYIRPKGQGSLTQLPMIELISDGVTSENESLVSGNAARFVSSNLDLDTLPQEVTTFDNIVIDDFSDDQQIIELSEAVYENTTATEEAHIIPEGHVNEEDSTYENDATETHIAEERGTDDIPADHLHEEGIISDLPTGENYPSDTHIEVQSPIEDHTSSELPTHENDAAETNLEEHGPHEGDIINDLATSEDNAIETNIVVEPNQNEDVTINDMPINGNDVTETGIEEQSPGEDIDINDSPKTENDATETKIEQSEMSDTNRDD